MKRPFVLFVVLSVGAFALSSCSSQEESTAGSAAASLLDPAPSSAAASTQTAADLTAMPDVVAKVNDTEITRAELVARAESIQERLPAGTGRDSLDFYRRVLDDLIGSALLYQSSIAKGFVPTEAEVDAQIAEIRSQFPDQAQFGQALAAQGLNEEKLRGMTTRSLGVQAMIETDLGKGIEVTAEHKQTFYQQNLERMKEPEQVRLSHILVSADENATPEQRDQAKKKTEDIRARAMAGEDFATLARENSDDPGSKANGGELPWVGRGDTVPPFEAAAFALSPGEISEVVETRYGYHVIKLAERKEGGVVTFEQAEPRIEQVLRDQAIQERLRTEIEALRAAGDIEIFI
ncbi:MAG TPA: peptidylprolyl isomerase [Vicinamibacteria bacterium]|jgi:peptidyl-prolyl cis-trans isomerase C